MFKYAMFSGPHPSLHVGCPTCASPAGHYCDRFGEPSDRPHEARSVLAGTVEGWYQGRRELRDGSVKLGVVHYMVGAKALCGYRPSATTEMTVVTLDDNSRSCDTCVLRSWSYLEGRRW